MPQNYAIHLMDDPVTQQVTGVKPKTQQLADEWLIPLRPLAFSDSEIIDYILNSAIVSQSERFITITHKSILDAAGLYWTIVTFFHY